MKKSSLLLWAGMRSVFIPNARISKTARWIVVVFWILLPVLVWNPLMPKGFPSIGEIFKAFGPLVQEQDLIPHLLATLKLTFQAIGYSVILSFVIAFLATLPFFRPVAYAVSKARFLSLVGFVVIFIMLAHSDAHQTRLYLLMFGLVPYLTTTFTAIIMSVERDTFDYAKTLQLTPLQTTWHVLILGKAGELVESIRQNLAIAFTMIVFVESTLMEGGGLGVLLYNLRKYAHGYDMVFSVQIMILSMGVCIDALVQTLNKTLFPYAFIKRQVK